ncbi:MAG TPA: sulfite exporter TauE/SafE family protein [Gammaproteobacteria bacterium]|nr:sulfite exporter TauE/SafE family protein [Gammaproteobacteria bacterium]
MPALSFVLAVEAAASGVLVGLALGLTGGGGSIFAVPLLVYVLGLAPEDAVPISLVAVALTALVGAVQAVRHRLAVWQPAAIFAVGGVIGAPLGLAGARHVPHEWLLAGFAILALTVGGLMWRASRVAPAQASAVRARVYPADAGPVCALEPEGQLRFTAPCAAVLAATGIGTGLLSGLFGVGGGFLIVPALVLVTRMGIHRAVATSLLIITAIGFAGAAGAVWQNRIDWPLLAPFAAGGAAAMIAGRRLAARLAGPRLQRTFSVLIVAVGAGMLIDALI